MDDTVGSIIMLSILLALNVSLCGLICHMITFPKKIVVYSTPNFFQAAADFPLPPQYRKLKWPRWKKWACYLREQDDKPFGLFYARTVPDGLIIREYSPINYVKPKIVFFVPWRTLSEPKPIKSPWYIWTKRTFALNIANSPITLLITKRASEKIKDNL